MTTYKGADVSTPNKNEILFDENEFIVSKTDLQGRIIYGNALFIKISGYSEGELLGSPHNILRHPDMPKAIFKLLWQNVQEGHEIVAFVKNMTRDGSFYWVEAQVTPSFDENGEIIGYHSVRRKPSRKAVEFFDKLYRDMTPIENSGGVNAGSKYIQNILDAKGISYEQFVLTF